MHQPLIQHIRRFVSITDKEAGQILPLFEFHNVKKKTILQQGGTLCDERYFVCKGCLRSYLVDEEDTAQVLQFAIENWWITDYGCFGLQTPSALYIQALEDAEVLVLTSASMQQLLERLPVLEKYFRLVAEKAYNASILRNYYMVSLTVEERYKHFRDAFPEFLQRVPQYMLASYLGFTPEFLSRMRARGV